jgi:hypothetical protein
MTTEANNEATTKANNEANAEASNEAKTEANDGVKAEASDQAKTKAEAGNQGTHGVAAATASGSAAGGAAAASAAPASAKPAAAKPAATKPAGASATSAAAPIAAAVAAAPAAVVPAVPMSRLNKVLLALLAGQLLLAALVLSRGGPDAPVRPQPLLPGFDAAAVMRLQLFPALDPQAAATPAPRPIDLVKRGDAWVVASAFDYPAQTTPITELLGKLGGLTRTSPVAEQPARHKQLEVADASYQRKVVITAGGKDLTLYVGGAIGARQTAVRVGGTGAVYAVNGLTAWGIDTQLRTWVTTSYASLTKDEISQLQVQREGESVQLSRDGATWKLAGAPIPAGEELDTAIVDEVLGQVSQVELVDIGDPKRDASRPTATITVWTQPKEQAATASPAAPAAAPAAPGATPGATPAVPAAPAATSATAAAPGTSPAAAAPAGAAAAAPAGAAAPAAPALVLTVLEQDGKYWVMKQGETRAVLVDDARLRTTVELARANLVKKVAKPVAAPPPGAPAAPGPAGIPGLPPGALPPAQ